MPNSFLKGLLGGTPSNGTDMVNSATNTAIDNSRNAYDLDKFVRSAAQSYAQAEQARQQAQQQEDIKQGLVQGLLGSGFQSSGEKNAASDLIRYKTEYDNYNKQAMSENDEAKRANLLTARDQAAQKADLARSIYDGLGYNLEGYGPGVSLTEAAKNFAIDNQNGFKNLIDSYKTADDVYNEEYNKLRKQGYWKDDAREEAGRRAARYQAEQLARYQEGMRAYGYADDGSLNDYGLQLLGLMKNDDPELANMWLGANANPANRWQMEQGRKNAAIQQGYAKENAATQQRYHERNAAINHQYGFEDRADAYKYNRMVAYDNAAIQQAQRQAAYNEQVNRIYTALRANGMDEQSATANALAYASGLVNSNGNSKKQNSNSYPADIEKSLRTMTSDIEEIKGIINDINPDGDPQEDMKNIQAGEKLDEMKVQLERLKPFIDEDDYTTILRTIASLLSDRQRKAYPNSPNPYDWTE